MSYDKSKKEYKIDEHQNILAFGEDFWATGNFELYLHTNVDSH